MASELLAAFGAGKMYFGLESLVFPGIEGKRQKFFQRHKILYTVIMVYIEHHGYFKLIAQFQHIGGGVGFIIVSRIIRFRILSGSPAKFSLNLDIDADLSL